MARYPSSLVPLYTLLLALLFSSLIHAQVAAPAAPVAAPAAPVAAPAAPVAAPADPAPAPANPAPVPAAPAAPAAPVGGGAGVGGVGVGGAAGVPVLAPTQYPIVLNVPKIVTLTGVDGRKTTTSTDTMFTQTFASTALETWHFASPKTGTVGLGGLKGAPAGWKPLETGA